MLVDKQLAFSEAQQVLTGTVVSTNVIDLAGIAGIDRTCMRIAVNVSTAFAGGTSVQVVLQTSAAEGFGSATALFTGPAVALAALTAGASVADFEVPAGALRYLRLQYVVVGTHTAGNVNAHLVNGAPTARTSYPDAAEVF